MSIDINSPLWTPQDTGNTAPVPDGLPSGTEAAKLYPLIWAERGAIKREYLTSNPTATATILGTNPLVYVLNYPLAPTINEGKQITFNVSANNNAGANRIMINGTYYDLKSYFVNTNGDLFAGEMNTNVPVTIAYKGSAFVLVNSQLANASNIATGTVDDARLPTTMAGKTFSSNVNITAALTAATLAGNGAAVTNVNAITLAGFTPATLPVSTAVQSTINGLGNASTKNFFYGTAAPTSNFGADGDVYFRYE